MMISFEEEIESQIADRIAGAIVWGGLACIIISAICNNDKDQKSISDGEQSSEISEEKSSEITQGRWIKKMYTVDDICERIAENLPAGFSSLEIIVNLPQKIREDIRFYLKMEVISNSEVNIYGNFFGDDDRDEINLLGVCKIFACEEKAGNTQISLPPEFSSEAPRYSRILGVKDADKTDFMQLIEIMRGRFHQDIDSGHITDDELYKKIIEQEECIETNYLENQKKTFHIFKIGNHQFPASKTFIKEIIIPILKGSELVYQGTDKSKFCKSIS